MKILSICIPNYNRIEKLEKLLREAASQIIKDGMTGQVQICVSDDYSHEDPSGLISTVQEDYPQVEIRFERNKENRGMDYNFLNSVLMASSEYCWIIGNDDMPTENGITDAVNILTKKGKIDILLTPFHLYGKNGEFSGTIYPLKENVEKRYDTSIPGKYSELIFAITHNSGLFGFLSNVIFKRHNWIKNKECFKDKMDTIFIQMYMNIQTLADGAVYMYMPNIIIKNYADDKTNESIERICRILFGLDGVVEYFFKGMEKEYLKRIIVDEYISGKVWTLADETSYKKKVLEIISPKNQLYKKYYIPIMQRENFFKEKKFIIYGTGAYGRQAYKELKQYGGSVIGAADSATLKKGKNFEEFKIISVSEMRELYREQKAYVLVANHFALEDMVHTLLSNGIERIAIVT